MGKSYSKQGLLQTDSTDSTRILPAVCANYQYKDASPGVWLFDSSTALSNSPKMDYDYQFDKSTTLGL